MREFSVGEEFAGHRIEGVAGQGGMGVVYRATDLRLKRSVALKLIAPRFAEDPDFRRRFEQESELAASIRHPNVITIYSAGEAEGSLYITMELVEGTDLKEVISYYGALDPAFSARVIAQFVGTLDYIAPEQLKGDQVDARTDVYSLACVFFQSLTGQVPYPRDSEPAKMWAHVGEPPPHVNQMAPQLPPELDRVVQTGMAKDKEQRYQSAGQLGEAAPGAAGGSEGVPG